MKDESLSVCLGLIPVATLAAGTVVGQRVAMPDEVVACLSNTSTGLMTAILCMDLMPEVINEARGRADKAAVGVGLGVASLALVGLYAATEYQQRKLAAAVAADAPPPSPSRVPVSTIVSALVVLFLYGTIIGASLDEAAAAKNTVGAIVATTLAVDAFLVGTETASIFAEHERKAWEAALVSTGGAAVLLLGCFGGGAMQSYRRRRDGGGGAAASSFLSFAFLGVSVAAALAVISQSQRVATDKEEATARWYPTIFIYVGFALVLAVQWTSKSLARKQA
jgi:hypothetical protein